MSNPRVSFRLSKHQLARGLQTLRQLDPNFIVTSYSQIVKASYHEAIAKMSSNPDNEVDPSILAEIEALSNNKSTGISLNELIQITQKPSETLASDWENKSLAKTNGCGAERRS